MTKILLFDIETAPNEGYTWGKYEQDVIEFTNDWYILCFAAKWLNEKKIITSALPDFRRYKKDKKDDYYVVQALWDLLNEADIVVSHNGNKFDIRKANARFVYHKLIPPSNFLSVDTLQVAKRYFSFCSNRLNDLGSYLNLGNKIEHEGFGLWKKCMKGNMKAWKRMLKYNVQDVKLLEKLYLKLRPWITNHPNRALIDRKTKACPNCGKEELIKNGMGYTRVNIYQRWRCKKCGASCSSRLSEKIEKPFVK